MTGHLNSQKTMTIGWFFGSARPTLQLSTELESTREQVAAAQERASATERRALREIDRERTLRQKGGPAHRAGGRAGKGARRRCGRSRGTGAAADGARHAQPATGNWLIVVFIFS